MPKKTQPSFLFLALLISFGTVAAVCITPALPLISTYFAASAGKTGYLISGYLLGFAIGPLLYGPLTHRFGLKKALYMGMFLAIFSSLMCILASVIPSLSLLIIARIFLAIGTSSGVPIALSLASTLYSPHDAKKLIAQLLMILSLSSPITVAISGVIVNHLNWQICFGLLIVESLIILLLSHSLIEPQKHLDKNALRWKPIYQNYRMKLTNPPFYLSAIIVGLISGIVYLFATRAPFIAIQIMGLNPIKYGFWNLLPAVGTVVGAQIVAHLSHRIKAITGMRIGLAIILLTSLGMLWGFLTNHLGTIYLFGPMIFLNMGLIITYSNATAQAMEVAKNKANGSAMLSFINIGVATVTLLLTNSLPNFKVWYLPFIYLIIFSITFLILILVTRGLEKVQRNISEA